MIGRKKEKDLKSVKPKDKSKKKVQSTYKSIEEYKPTGSFVYNQSAMSAMGSLENKSAELLQVKTLNI